MYVHLTFVLIKNALVNLGLFYLKLNVGFKLKSFGLK